MNMSSRSRIFWGSIGACLIGASLFTGFFIRKTQHNEPVVKIDTPRYHTGWYDAAFYDGAYRASQAEPIEGIVSGLVAHHLLVADKIASVFESMASTEVQTVVIVSPNHFQRGVALAQISQGTWETDYGSVETDVQAVEVLLDAVPFLRHEETAFAGEHGVYGLMPFVARSFPNARVVSIVLQESVSLQDAWILGEGIAQALPNAVLFASVDMTHNRDADFTAQNDARVLGALEQGGWCGYAPCTETFVIDSNASLRTLFAFNHARGTSAWHLTHHGSSLAMGVTTNPEENTSHILGYFTQ